jgi:histidine triad (HIT) family protein
MTSIFTRIVNREIPAHILREDDDYLAFLDVRPIRAGHSLVIPKREIDDVFDLPDALLSGLLVFARPVAHAIREASGAQRVGMAVLGIEVPHAHVHLVPIDGIGDLDFRKAKPADDEDLAAMAEQIRDRIQSGG